jgi:hypothetical protein
MVFAVVRMYVYEILEKNVLRMLTNANEIWQAFGLLLIFSLLMKTW